MNKLKIDSSKVYTNNGIYFLSLTKNCVIDCQANDLTLYLFIKGDVSVELLCHHQVRVYQLNVNYRFQLLARLVDDGVLTYHAGCLATKKVEQLYRVKHEACKTSSQIIVHGISSEEGNLSITVDGIVPKGKKQCVCQQTSQALILKEGKALIQPNLLIDEYDVVADHAAYMGPFPQEKIFYLQTKGMTKTLIYQLLLTAFLVFDSKEERYVQLVEECLERL